MEIAYFVCCLWASLTVTALTANSVVNFLYASNMVFNVLKPEGHEGPLYDKAVDLIESHPELMLARRLYAIEAWLTSVPAGLGIALVPLLWLYTTSVSPF